MKADWKTANQVLNWRVDQGLTYEKAADVLGVSPKTLYNWEHQGHAPSKLTLARCLRRIAEYNGSQSRRSQ